VAVEVAVEPIQTLAAGAAVLVRRVHGLRSITAVTADLLEYTDQLLRQLQTVQIMAAIWVVEEVATLIATAAAVALVASLLNTCTNLLEINYVCKS
jgi:hypothetical protein